MYIRKKESDASCFTDRNSIRKVLPKSTFFTTSASSSFFYALYHKLCIRDRVSRIAYLIEERGVKPDEITAVTFTNQAAAEMRQRLEKRLGGKRAVSRMTIGTFHAICLHMLGDVRLISRGEALTIAADVLAETESRRTAGSLLQAVSRIKNSASFETAELDEALYTAYCTQLQKRGMLDFDDLLSEGLKLDTVGRKSFHYLLVDEFQDINAVQYKLVCAWHENGKSLFVIGAPDQSIYGFRGATGRCV